MYSGGGYDAVHILAKAWETADPADHKASSDAIRTLTYRGVNGFYQFNNANQAPRVPRRDQQHRRSSGSPDLPGARWQARHHLARGRCRGEVQADAVDEVGVGSSAAQVLECSEVSLRFGPVSVLNGVSLQVRPGEVIGVAGPNGAGKTSLLEVLAGRYRPYEGSVRLGGTDVTDIPVHHRARLGIGRLYQRPVVPTNLTVRQAFESARRAYRPRPTAHQLDWAREMVGLHVSDDRLCGTLETLDRRRLLLACVLVRRPQVLLLDEPASASPARRSTNSSC